jgi:hypothetical protein
MSEIKSQVAFLGGLAFSFEKMRRLYEAWKINNHIFYYSYAVF